MKTRFEYINGCTRKNAYIKDFRILGKRGKNDSYVVELSNGDGSYTRITEKPTIKAATDFIRSMYK